MMDTKKSPKNQKKKPGKKVTSKETATVEKTVPTNTKSHQLFLKGREIASKDERFAAVASNPIYRSVPKAEKKIDIDSRFKSMFHDDKFKLKYKVDKRGRPVNTTTDENLKKYYNLVDDDEDNEVKSESDKDSISDGDEEEGDVDNDDDDVKSEDGSSSEEDEDDDDDESVMKISTKTNLSEEIKKKVRSNHVDYARGEGDFVSEESSDEDSSDAGGDEEEVEHGWGEMDKDAERTEDCTRRLALCNMDWDRLKSTDLMVLFNSFLPPGGVLQSVSIFVSEYGKKRMEEEELRGPIELAQFKQEVTSDNEEEDRDVGSDEEEEEGSTYHREKLREYQLNRLKYFYAVLEFDSTSTAEKVYGECDGMEYESSAAMIDLRYIPDDMVFEEEPKEKCQSLPDSTKYRPKFFTTTALQQVKVDCTWDETDPSRKEIIGRVLDKNEKVDDEDLKAYLASSSSESENEDSDIEDTDDVKVKEDTSDPIAKYRALLEGIESAEKKKKNEDIGLEITWGVGLKKKAEDLVKKKAEEHEIEQLTPWEAQLVKQKEKKKQRKYQKKKGEGGSENSEDSSEAEGSDVPFSDDDVDIDLDDPFFKEELAARSKSQKATKKPKKNEKENPDEAETKSQGELDLLLMDEDDGKKHFNFKKLIEDETLSKSKRKRKFKKAKKLENKNKSADKKAENEDEFQVDVEDNRFSKLYSSHHYNIDPSEPNFKKTKGMDKIIQKKQAARTFNSNDQEGPKAKLPKLDEISKSDDVIPSPTGKIRETAELSCLVKSIKKNTQNAQMTKSKSNFKNKLKR